MNDHYLYLCPTIAEFAFRVIYQTKAKRHNVQLICKRFPVILLMLVARRCLNGMMTARDMCATKLTQSVWNFVRKQCKEMYAYIYLGNCVPNQIH